MIVTAFSLFLLYNASMSKKKPLDPLTKAKLLIQGEYLLISLIFLACGILKIFDILKSSELRAHIFNFVTLAGSLWVIADFLWCTISKKKRAKVTYLDKILALPLGLYLLVFDIISLIRWTNVDDWYKYGISIAFFLIFLVYSFEAVYHWFYPTKMLLEAVEQDEAAKLDEKKNEEKPIAGEADQKCSDDKADDKK